MCIGASASTPVHAVYNYALQYRENPQDFAGVRHTAGSKVALATRT